MISKKKAGWLWVNGAGVVYRRHIYQIDQVNKEDNKCTLIGLPHEELVFNVPLAELDEEWGYDWEDDD